MIGGRDWLEIVMRLTPFVLCLGLAASTLPMAVVGQRPDDQIAPQSVALMKQGEALLAQGKFIEADDALETALVVDPKNRAAFTLRSRKSCTARRSASPTRLWPSSPLTGMRWQFRAKRWSSWERCREPRTISPSCSSCAAPPAARRLRYCRPLSPRARRWQPPSRLKFPRRIRTKRARARQIHRR